MEGFINKYVDEARSAAGDTDPVKNASSEIA